METLQEIYQDSIETLANYWTNARDEGDETIIVDQILYYYQHEIQNLNMDRGKVIEELSDWALNGIN